MRRRATWCIKDKAGIWCATADGGKPDENATSVATACGDWIVLPHGTAYRKSTCPRCQAAPANTGEKPS